MVERAEKPTVIVDESRIVAMIQLALQGRKNHEGIFSQEIEPPEKELIDLFKKHETQSGQKNFALHALFFFITTLYADNSTRQLNGASDRFDNSEIPYLFEHPELAANIDYSWLFDPYELASREQSQVVATARDLVRPGHNKEAVNKWQHNAQVLVDKYDGQLTNYFAEHDNIAPTILENLVGPKRKQGYEGFHRFGLKIGRLFLQWVGQYQLAEVKEIENIGIPVDFQVARLIIQTGGVQIEGTVHKHWVLDKQLNPLFADLCSRNNLPSWYVSETLWLIGNRCCNNYYHHLCPLESVCDRMIARNPMDIEGKFDTRDIGRWKTTQQIKSQRKDTKAEQERMKMVQRGQQVMFDLNDGGV